MYRHQVVEVPPVKLIVIEHRFHQMTCTCCGKENQAPLMAEIISKGGYGSRVAAYIGLFSSQYRQSYSNVRDS
ncbi:MAG: IS66 family transposase zinc-finger binding domain-containing protein [Pseudanabaena sp.]|nr:IS66 family transposase zinc-finger binding domain-containing protein [Pseudanabaena sp. M109S1SP2A07QC]